MNIRKYAPVTCLLVLGILVLAAMVISGCSGSSTSVQSQPVDNTYPQNIGNRWVYEVLDSTPPNTVKRYELIVNVLDTTTLSGGRHVFLWSYTNSFSFPETSDTQYVMVSGDSVIIYDDRGESTASQKYFFPLSVGKLWSGPFEGDTTRITSLTGVSLPIQYFPSTYIMNRKIPVQTGKAADLTLYYVAHVGIIALTGWDQSGGIQTYHVWNVITYRVNE